jgi:hypothetical protein
MAGVTNRTVYGLGSAITRTKCGGTDEYLFALFMFRVMEFVVWKRWIGAFGKELKNRQAPDLGEVRALSGTLQLVRPVWIRRMGCGSFKLAPSIFTYLNLQLLCMNLRIGA